VNEHEVPASEDAEGVVETGAEPPAEVTSRRGHTRVRSVIASVLGVLAVIVLVVGVVAVWAQATVLRGERVAELVNDAIDEPEVQAALAAYLADEAQRAVNLETRLKDLLPSQLDRLAPPLAAGANAAVERVLENVLANPATHDAITTLVERAHARAMRLLEGDGIADGVNVANGEVSINLLPLVAQGLTALQSIGLLDDVVVPDLKAGGDPEQQAAELSAAIGRDLPAGFAQLVVYQSERVEDAQEAVQTAQRLLVLAKRALWLIVILTVVLIAATILVAPRRLRAVLVLALGTAAAMVLVRSVVREVVSGAGDIVLQPGAKAAMRAIIGGAGTWLMRLAGVILLISLVTTGAVMFARRQWRADLVLAAAVMLGAITVAVLGVTWWALVIGIVVGVAVPFVARKFMPAREPELVAPC
jgi:hypothetical protein